MKTLSEKIQVMQAALEGKPIQVKGVSCWYHSDDPSWNWGEYDYRVAVTKPSINWDHVSSEYKYLAVDPDGSAWLYTKPPTIFNNERWCASCCGNWTKASVFISLKLGTCGWKDSLVERPS